MDLSGLGQDDRREPAELHLRLHEQAGGSERYRAGGECVAVFSWSADERGGDMGERAAYNAAGQLTDLERLGSETSTCTGFSPGYYNQHWQYNALNQLTEIDTSAQSAGFPVPSPNPGTANVFFERYHFSGTANNGQVTSVDDARQSGANIAYTYDALKRLTTASTSAWNQSMTYDGFGNITSKSVPSGSSEPVFPGAVSSKNWLAGVNYDANGNALAVNAFALTYDMENRLATATSGTVVETYFYDEANHRVEKTMGTNDYLYFYGPSEKLLSIRSVAANGVTSVVADRVYFGGMLLGSAGASGNLDVSDLDGPAGDGGDGVSVWDGFERVGGGERSAGLCDLHAGWDDGIRVCESSVLFGGDGEVFDGGPIWWERVGRQPAELESLRLHPI